MKFYIKSAPVQAIALKAENLDALRALPDVTYLEPGEGTKWADHTREANQLVLVAGEQSGNVAAVFLRVAYELPRTAAKTGRHRYLDSYGVEGLPGDYLVVEEGRRRLVDPETFQQLYREVPLPERFYLSHKSFLSEIARWAVYQSPYACPDGLPEVLAAFSAATQPLFDEFGMRHVTLAELGQLLDEHLLPLPQVQAWNQRRNGAEGDKFTSRYGYGKIVHPAGDFIDLDALRLNVLYAIEVDQLAEEIGSDNFNKQVEANANWSHGYFEQLLKWLEQARPAADPANWPTPIEDDPVKTDIIKKAGLRQLDLVTARVKEFLQEFEHNLRFPEGHDLSDFGRLPSLPSNELFMSPEVMKVVLRLAELTMPDSDADWEGVARVLMTLVMLDNGAVNRDEPLLANRFPKQHLRAIAAAAKNYFTAHPECLTADIFDTIATGGEDEPDFKALPPFPALHDALNDFFNSGMEASDD